MSVKCSKTISIILRFTLQPRHMAVSMDKFKYKLPYKSDEKLIWSHVF